MLDMRRLEVLVAVVDTGSVTGAATRLGFTPSSVSQQMSLLEREIGLPLLEKSGRSVRPTVAGVTLAEQAEVILRAMTGAEQVMEDMREGRVGRVRLATFASAGDSLLPLAVAELRRSMPGLHIATSILEDDQVSEAFRVGTLDVAITLEPFGAGDAPEDGYLRTHLLDDPYRLIMPSSHALAGRSSVELLDVAGEDWVSCVGATGACHDATVVVCREFGFEPTFVAEAAEFPAAQAYVAAGLGVSLVPVLALGSVRKGVVVKRLRREPEARHVWLVVRPAVASTLPVRETVRAIRAATAAHERATRSAEAVSA